MSTRRTLRLALLASVLGVGGCDIVSPGAEDAAADLDRARDRWEASGVASYQLHIERVCYCPLVGPVTLTVENGQPVLVVPDDPYATDVPLAAFPTVEGLFDVVEDALRRRAHRLTVVYHPTLGYPTDISVDFRENVVDEEISYEAALRVLDEVLTIG